MAGSFSRTAGDAPDLDARIALRLREAFARGSGEGLWRLGAFEAGATLPPVFIWWRDFAARFVAALRRRPRELDEPIGEAVTAGIEPPTPAELASLALTAPMMAGAEYLDVRRVLRDLWQALDAAFAHAFAAAGTDLQSFLAQCNPAWTLVGRVHFNLAENRRDPDFPVRLHGDLHDRPLGRRQGPASAVGRSAAPICRGARTKTSFCRCSSRFSAPRTNAIG